MTENWIKTIKFIIFIIAFIVGTTIATFNIFATNKRVDEIDYAQKHIKNIICNMAIDLKWTKTNDACLSK